MVSFLTFFFQVEAEQQHKTLHSLFFGKVFNLGQKMWTEFCETLRFVFGKGIWKLELQTIGDKF